MPTVATLIKGVGEGVLITPLQYTKRDAAFTRADLIFTGVDHSGLSYEVRVFLNNRGATATTPRDPALGYAGRYVIFGHGGCYGDEGHCDVPPPSIDPTDLRFPHQLTLQTKLVTITKTLKKVLAEQPEGLQSVTIVPVSKAPRQADRAALHPEPGFESVHLETYLTATEEDAQTG